MTQVPVTQVSEFDVLADVPRVLAHERGMQTAMIFGDRETSYGNFDSHSSQVANGLILEGCAPGSRVAFLDKNSDWYFEALFGAAKANAVMVSVNWRLAAPEVEYILRDAEAELLFVGPEFFALAEAVADKLPRLRKIIALTDAGDDHSRGWEGFAAWRDRQAQVDPRLACDAEDIAVQMYTSGTTGHPKGVLLPHRSFFAVDKAGQDAPQEWNSWQEGDNNLVMMPCFHIGGTIAGVRGLYNGVTNIIVSEFVPAEILSIIERYRISKVIMVPAMMAFLLADPKAKQTDFSSLDYVAYGTAPIPLDLLRQAMAVFKCKFVQAYGLTETTASATYLPPEDHDPNGNRRMRSAGKPMTGCAVKIVGPDGAELPPEEVGEICVRSPANMAGYWKLPDASGKTLIDGWVHTGDAGFKDADGYVYLHDRIKDMIVSGGENVYPAEVESAIFGHPAVAEIAVIGVPDERWGEAVKAIVVRKPGIAVTPEEIIAYARENIAHYKAPRSVDFVEILPRNAAGKLLKRELRKPYWEGRDRQVN